MSNIYLVGMMGSGKTVTGIKLADCMKKQFVDLDSRIQKKENSTIAEIFKNQGEPYFRTKETEALEEVSHLKESVVATGGGIVLRPENVQMMQSTGLVVYLETSVDVLWERVQGRRGRPLLEAEDPRTRLVEIFEKREAYYRDSSHVTVHTDRKTAETVASDIQQRIEHRR